MPKLKLRNAYLRGWFAARSDRGLPEPDGLAEKVFIDRGYEAGAESGGRALAMLDNPESVAASVAEVDVEAVIQEYRARKAAQQALAESQAVEPPPPVEEIPLQDPASPPDTTESDATESDEPAPAIKPRKSRWDDDDDAVVAAKEMTATSPGPRRRYGR